MLTAWTLAEKGLLRSEIANGELPSGTVWIDAMDISREEEVLIEQKLGIEVPTRAEMQEIEASSRLYREGGAVYMTATMLIKTETESPETTAVTFILSRSCLVTLRYAEPWSFRIFNTRASKCGATNAELVFLGILETTVERLADMLELVSLELEHISQQTFRRNHAVRDGDHQRTLIKIGRCGNIAGKVRESLVDKNRMVIFAEQATSEWLCAEGRARVHAIHRDVQSLTDHASYTAGKIAFLLDATLGLVNIEQNRIIKLFSIAAVIFMPPTMIASIYGMNFHHNFPELDWTFGYPFALLLMISSVAVTLWFFKRKHWL